MHKNKLTHSSIINLSVENLDSINKNELTIFLIDEEKKNNEALHNEEKTIYKIFEKNKFTGKKNECIDFILSNNSGEIFSLAFIGVEKKLKKEELKSIAAKIISITSKNKSEKINLVLDEKFLSLEEASFLMEEVIQKTYNFNKYFIEKKNEHENHLKEIIINSDISDLKNEINKIQNKMFAVFITRDLVMEPSNVIYPESIKKICEQLETLGLEIEVLDKKKMEEENMNLLLSVAKGSEKSPYTILIKWKGNKSEDFSKNLISIVGKGVTFDSGGINIKANPLNMKCDMAGASAVIGAMVAFAKNKIEKNVLGAIGLVENMPSGTSMKPDDVIFSMSGKTVEIDNTDAEGRLVLADILTYVQKYYSPKYIVDLATLTGAIMIALGSYYAGLFSDDDDFANEIILAGKSSNDKVWRMPLADHYDKMNDSHIADIKNCAREVGSTTAAQFLKRFINKDVKWAHIDIAGAAYDDKYKLGTTSTSRATGFGVRLIYDLVNLLYG